MNEKNLRAAVIKLAQENPSLRSDLLPILKEASYGKEIIEAIKEEAGYYCDNDIGSTFGGVLSLDLDEVIEELRHDGGYKELVELLIKMDSCVKEVRRTDRKIVNLIRNL